MSSEGSPQEVFWPSPTAMLRGCGLDTMDALSEAIATAGGFDSEAVSLQTNPALEQRSTPACLLGVEYPRILILRRIEFPASVDYIECAAVDLRKISLAFQRANALDRTQVGDLDELMVAAGCGTSDAFLDWMEARLPEMVRAYSFDVYQVARQGVADGEGLTITLESGATGFQVNLDFPFSVTAASAFLDTVGGMLEDAYWGIEYGTSTGAWVEDEATPSTLGAVGRPTTVRPGGEESPVSSVPHISRLVEVPDVLPSWWWRRPHLFPALVSAAMLFSALGPHQYAYFQTLRWVVASSAVICCFVMDEVRRTKSTPAGIEFGIVVFAGLAILFNPIFPVTLARETWIPVDGLAAVTFLVVAVGVERRRTPH